MVLSLVCDTGCQCSVLAPLNAGENEVVEDLDASASGVSQASGEDIRFDLAALLALDRFCVRPEELLLDELNPLEGQVVFSVL